MANRNTFRFQTAAAKLIQEILKRHNKIGLVNFMHDITFGKGQISMLVSNAETFNFFVDNKVPMLCTDEMGRTLAEGIYLNKVLESSYSDCSILMPLLPKVSEYFNQSYGKHSVHIVTKESDCQHLFSLFFNLEENDFLHYILNNGEFIKDMIEGYKSIAGDTILEAKDEESRVVLPNSSDYCFTMKTKNNDSSMSVIHKYLNIPIHLSKQQSKCLKLLLSGITIKQIASEMNLSPRTVEHYLENIRAQVGCKSNKELMANYSKNF